MRPGLADLQKCLRSRSHFLRCLRRPRQKCELARELAESRSTIDRALRELEDAGFVEREETGYRTSLAGELALAEYDRYTARLDGLVELQPMIDGLPTDEPLDGAVFEGADASLPDQCSPHEPVEALATFLSQAEHARVFGTAVLPQHVDLYYERIVEEDMTADFVLSEGVVEWLLSRREEQAMGILRAEGVTAAETTTDLSFSFVISERGETTEREESSGSGVHHGESDRVGGVSGNADSTRPKRSVGVMLYEESSLVGFVHNDAREAVAWADALFERIADEAVSLGVLVEN